MTWENRDLLDPAVEESLMSGGVELPAQTQLELNLSSITIMSPVQFAMLAHAHV